MKRYIVEFLREPVALALVAKRGGNPETDSIWDFCQEDEITEQRTFKTKGLAFAYARKNASRDMYQLPRVFAQIAETESFEGTRWISWNSAGAWELDGTEVTEIYRD